MILATPISFRLGSVFSIVFGSTTAQASVRSLFRASTSCENIKFSSAPLLSKFTIS